MNLFRLSFYVHDGEAEGTWRGVIKVADQA